MPTNETHAQDSSEQVVPHDCGRYPIECVRFPSATALPTPSNKSTANAAPSHDQIRTTHVLPRLRPATLLGPPADERAVHRYGLLAPSPSSTIGGITRTDDFGRIVFAMVDSKLMAKTDDDDIRDFHNVFDFPTAFSSPHPPPTQPPYPVFQI